jgi:L-threonylcarbamoyladenylate synthase
VKVVEVIKTGRKGGKALARAVQVMLRGGLVAYPTETSYGLGCDATNEEAVRRVFKAKARNAEKSLPIIVASTSMAAKYLWLDDRALALAKKFMPGPLSLVVPRKKGLARSLSSTGTISFRVSSHEFARALASRLGKPVVATSANISGEPPAYSPQEIVSRFGDEVDLVVDAGKLAERPPSTVLNLASPKPELLRKGVLAVEVTRFLQRFSSNRHRPEKKKLVRRRTQRPKPLPHPSKQ